MFARLATRFRRSNRTADVAPVTTDPKEVKEVHEWDRPIEFLFSLISNSVGLGNVWRFPYLAARNGGGAFLIPYFILYFLIGAPIYYLELALGQFSSRGPATAFIFARGWQGVGIAMIINSVLGMLYYNVIIAWALFYFVLSFRKTPLWSSCGQWWNSDNPPRCYEPRLTATYFQENGIKYNCTPAQYANFTANGCAVLNLTGKVPATEEFFYRLLLKKSPSFDEFGTPGTYMALSLLVAWIIVCLCIIRGVQSSGKVAYVTALLPYVVLLILIIFSATLDGAADGVKFYIIPKPSQLGDLKVWQAAAGQVFFSLGLGFGSLLAYASANKFNNKFFKQMCIVVSVDCFTGVFAGFAVFATIGFLAKSLGETVETYANSSGPGLAFITYPEALSSMPASPFFSVIFFLMLLALGLGSQFASTDVPVTAIMEYFPKLRSRRALIVVVTCSVCYIVSLPFTCPGGIYLFDLFQEYTANISLVVIGFFEVVTIGYIYGFNRFMGDVKMMLGRRAAQYYLFFTWLITAPILTIIITALNLVNSQALSNAPGGGFDAYIFPQWSTILGWFIFVVCILPIPLFFLISYIQQFIRLPHDTLVVGASGLDYARKPRYLVALTLNNSPREDWGPKKPANQWGDYDYLHNREIGKIDEQVSDPYLGQLGMTNNGHVNNPTFNPDPSANDTRF